MYNKNLFCKLYKNNIQSLLKMKPILHIMHIFSILIIAFSFTNYQLKAQNCNFKSYNFASHLDEAGTIFLYVQQLLGHWAIKTMIINTKVTNKALNGLQSSLNRLTINS